MRQRRSVIGVQVDAISWEEAVSRIVTWGRERHARVVCICNVHSLVTALGNRQLFEAINDSDMATSDGAPIAYMLRRLGHSRQQRINGPDLMLRCCAEAERLGVSIFLYGGASTTLVHLVEFLSVRFPDLTIAGHYSPPFRHLNAAEDAEVVRSINESGAGLLWVGLGCPKQEIWMADHVGRIRATMIGVGAAFDYHAGVVKRAPPWMQHSGLEWLFRLLSEPSRLWRRYLVTNSLFVGYAALQLIRERSITAKSWRRAE